MLSREMGSLLLEKRSIDSVSLFSATFFCMLLQESILIVYVTLLFHSGTHVGHQPVLRGPQ